MRSVPLDGGLIESPSCLYIVSFQHFAQLNQHLGLYVGSFTPAVLGFTPHPMPHVSTQQSNKPLRCDDSFGTNQSLVGCMYFHSLMFNPKCFTNSFLKVQRNQYPLVPDSSV